MSMKNSALDFLTLNIETPHCLEMSDMAVEPLWKSHN